MQLQEYFENTLDLLEDIKDSFQLNGSDSYCHRYATQGLFAVTQRGCSSMLNESLRVKCEKCDRNYDPLDP